MGRKFLIDTDTASDDAVALIMALRSPEIDVVAITVVSGNVPVGQGLKNALFTVELCGSETPVYRGAEAPLARPLVDAAFFHGHDGLGDRGYGPPTGEPAPGLAPDVIVEQIRAHPGVDLITLGPLTNVALALERDPGIVGQVGRCIVMGGAPCCVGNVTPAAEYNIWVDPEAARRVFHSGLPIEMVGWHLCRLDANLLQHEMDLVRGFGTPWADFALDCNETAIEANRLQSGDPGLALPDPVAMAVAIRPELCTRSSRHWVDVETQSELTRGMTVVDALDVARDERNAGVWSDLTRHEPNATVCWEIEIPAWKQLLYQSLR